MNQQSNLDEASALLAMNDEQFMDQAYVELFSNSFAIGNDEDASRRRAVLGWLAENKAHFQKMVCGPASTALREVEDNHQDSATLVVLIGDLIAASVVGISPLTAAAFIVRTGIKKFCSDAY